MAWTIKPLGDAMTFQRGFDITKAEQRAGQYWVISSSGPSSMHDQYKVKGPGVIIGRKGSLGTVHFSEENYWPHDTTLWVKNFHGNDPRFVYYFLQTMGFEKLDVGASNPTLNRNHIHLLPVRWPEDIETQRRIASILSAYDDLIENNTRRIAILEEMARRIYEEWFVRFRFPGHEGVRMVESELGLVPEGWQVVCLDEVCSRITDGSHSSPKSVEVGKPMASVKDMHDWGINLQSCRQISEEDYSYLLRNDCKPRLNDILIAKDGNTYLKHMFVIDEEVDMVILSSIAILRPNGRILPNQLATYLRLPHTKTRMRGYVSGAAIPRIVLRDFKQFLVHLPPKEIQDQWALLCDPMMSLCRKLVRKNTNLRATRDLLLPKLISGELDVSNMPDPAHNDALTSSAGLDQPA